MNDGKERREPWTQIAQGGRELAPIERVQVDNELHTALQGYVYLIVNDLIRTRVKIGYTTRDPIERAVELVTTGTTGTFVVIYAAMVRNPYAVEQEVHRRLKKHCCGQEWFELCPNRAKEEIFAVAGEVLYENTTPRWHRSQPEPSNETKVLLREAKQAADEKRRREEEEARQSRLAAEEARIKQAQEAAEAQRLADEEEYRRRAEEQAREAAIEEETRRASDEQRRRYAEARKRRTVRLRHLWRCLGWLGFASAALALVWGVFFAVMGPYSEAQIALIRREQEEMAAELLLLDSDLAKTQSELKDVREEVKRITSLSAATQQRLENALEAIDSARRLCEASLAYAERNLQKSGNAITPERKRWQVVYEVSRQQVANHNADERRVRREITGSARTLEEAKAAEQVILDRVGSRQEERKAKKKSLDGLEISLDRMVKHNRETAWMRLGWGGETR